MDIKQEKIDNLNSVVKVVLKPEDYQGRVDKAIKDHAKKVKLPGFRPGMVPPAHIKKMYGKSILVDEINNLLSDTLNNYITENKLEVLGQPLPKVDPEKQLKWEENQDFEFDYELGLAPEFDINFSSEDKLKSYDIKVDDETYESRSKNLRRSYGKMTNPDVSAEDDIIYAELQQLSTDGSVFEGGISNTGSIRYDLVQDEEIKKSLVGLKKDDVIDFDVQKAYGNNVQAIAKLLNISEEDAADLKSTFRLTVKNINRLDESDLDQEFFDKIYGEGTVKTEEEFKAKVVGELESMMVQDAERRLQADLHKLALEKIQFSLPDDFLKRWLKVTNENLSEEDLEKGYDDFATNLKWSLIENKIIQQNNIEIKYEDVFKAAKERLAAQFQMYSPQPLSEEQLGQYTVQFLQNKENSNRILEEVKAIAVFDYLKTVVTLDKEEISYNKFTELA